jgi:hypothetical protein
MLAISFDNEIFHLNIGDSLDIKQSSNPELVGKWRLLRYTPTKAFFRDGKRTLVINTAGGVLVETDPEDSC